MRKRVLLVLIALFAIGQYGFAYDFSAVAPSGQTLYYNYTDGINGAGVYVTCPVNSYPYYEEDTKPTGALTIPSSVNDGSRDYSVTSIGDAAFYGCSSLTSLTIPNSVTSIGRSAFYDCSSLTSLTIPNSVTSIGAQAFSYCRGLTSLTIPNSVTSIGDQAFRGCSGLTSVTIPNSVTSIGYGAFNKCRSLTSIVVESGNTHYDSRNNCNAIIQTDNNQLVQGCQNTIIPNSVTSIGEAAFSGCSSQTTPNTYW